MSMINEEKDPITTFINVFYDKAKKQKKRIEDILRKPKNERDKKLLKMLLKDNKSLRKIFKKVESTKGTGIKCPHCGHIITRTD